MNTPQTTRPTLVLPTPKKAASAGSHSPVPATTPAMPKAGSLERDQTTRPTKCAATPRNDPSAGSQLPAPIKAASAPMQRASGREQTTPQATIDSAPIGSAPVGSRTPPSPAIQEPAPRVALLGLADPFLALAADVLDDLEKVRIANENRLRQLTRDEADKDGEERGFGLTEDHPDVARLAALVAMLGTAEHQAALNLQRQMRKHPLGPWAKAQRGVGEKQIARLLAAIGDPYWNTLHDRPRTVSELWAYCGYHVLNFSADHSCSDIHISGVGGEQTGHPDQKPVDIQGRNVGVAPKRARGQKNNWSATAKMRAYLVAESTLKQLDKTCPVDADLKAAIHVDQCACSPLRKVYDATKVKYADAIHKAPCVRCGPAGKPAQAGSPLSDGHKHARAMRAMAKELLKELWREAHRIHQDTEAHG